MADMGLRGQKHSDALRIDPSISVRGVGGVQLVTAWVCGNKVVCASGRVRDVNAPISDPVDVLVVVDEVLYGVCKYGTVLWVAEGAYKEA